MSKYEKLIQKDQKFGKWTIRIPLFCKNTNNQWVSSCVCECGNHVNVMCMNLLNGKSTQCTLCAQKNRKGRNNPNWGGGKILDKENINALQATTDAPINVPKIEASLTSTSTCSVSGMPLNATTAYAIGVVGAMGTGSLTWRGGGSYGNVQTTMWIHRDLKPIIENRPIPEIIKLCQAVVDKYNTTNFPLPTF